jgi:hypothetical protein
MDSSQTSTRRPVEGRSARREAAPTPLEDVSMLAIHNYMRMQEPKGTSNILSGPVRPVVLDNGASPDNSDDSEESDDGICFSSFPIRVF